MMGGTRKPRRRWTCKYHATGHEVWRAVGSGREYVYCDGLRVYSQEALR